MKNDKKVSLRWTMYIPFIIVVLGFAGAILHDRKIIVFPWWFGMIPIIAGIYLLANAASYMANDKSFLENLKND